MTGMTHMCVIFLQRSMGAREKRRKRESTRERARVREREGGEDMGQIETVRDSPYTYIYVIFIYLYMCVCIYIIYIYIHTTYMIEKM